MLTPYKIGRTLEKGNKIMIRIFIEVPLFSKRWKEIGLGEEELRALQIMLLKILNLVRLWKEQEEFVK